ncbi:hypothetical protein [Rubripirellula obstinata]|nr:hypothetical protein [Rubripirellula obstinata]
MLPELPLLLDRIRTGDLLSRESLSGLDPDAVLDARDANEAFDTSWTDSHRKVNAAWDSASIADDDLKLAEAIRRDSFIAASNATTQHEIASYISDDFDLIARSSLLGLRDTFIESLWLAYDSHSVPMPQNGG